jgi:hypothetical protein
MTNHPTDKKKQATLADLQNQTKEQMGRFEELRGFL